MAKRKSEDSQKETSTERKVIMGVVVVAVVLLIGAIFLLGAVGSDDSGKTRISAESRPSDGKVLYERFCMGCHGDQGQGYIQPDAPPLNADGEVWQYTDEEITQFIIRDGGEVMPAMEDSLTDEEVQLIYDYIKEWWTPEQRAAQPGG